MSYSKNVAEVENYDGKKGAKIESKKQTKPGSNKNRESWNNDLARKTVVI